MSTPYMSEIRLFSFNFAPKGWAMCNGQLLPINQNQALFALLGTTYGGDGRTTFGLPDLRGRVATHTGSNFTLGERGGEETHTLLVNEMPQHSHVPHADTKTGDATVFNPMGAYLADAAPAQLYSAGSSSMVSMAPAMVASLGLGQSHENRQPYLTLNYCIALSGIFPSQN